MIIEPDRHDLESFWREAAVSLGLDPASPAPHFHFGDTIEFADVLAHVVLDGPKRATAGLIAEMEADGDPYPKAGDHWIVVDGQGAPRAVIQTREVRIAPFHTVDEAFAWDEGEGDRGLAFWRRVHIDHFERSCRRIGLSWSEDLDVFFERFDVVWPKVTARRPILRRPATEKEWRAYHELRRSLFERYSPSISYDPDYPESWEDSVFHLGMFSASDLQGCLQIRWQSSDEASFHLVAIRDDLQGQGIGRRMLLEGEIFARVNGRQTLRVFAEPEAEGFYRKLGFEDGPDWTLQPLSARAIPLKKHLKIEA